MYADLYRCYSGNISEVNRTVKCIAHTYFFLQLDYVMELLQTADLSLD